MTQISTDGCREREREEKEEGKERGIPTPSRKGGAPLPEPEPARPAVTASGIRLRWYDSGVVALVVASLACPFICLLKGG